MITTTLESRRCNASHPARVLGLLLTVFLTCNSALAKVSLRDPLPIELEALQEPRRVIAELPELQAEAVRAQDQERLALLYLAEANACRVIANWICQRDAGERAVLTADQPTLVDLRIRGLIAQARGQISLGDFSRGERTLADAELLLDQVDAPALASFPRRALSSGRRVAYARASIAASMIETSKAPMPPRALLLIPGQTES